MAKKRKHPMMPLWVSDFLGSAACSEMTGDQQAFYLLMLVHLWNLRERGLPCDRIELRRLLGVSLRLFRSTFTNVSEQFYEQNGRLFHQRVDEELAKLEARSKSASESATKRWSGSEQVGESMRTHMRTQCERNANGMHARVPSPSPSPSPEEEEPPYPHEVGDSIRKEGRNPRVRGTNPRAIGERMKVEETKRRNWLIANIEHHVDTTLIDGTEIERGGLYDPKLGTLAWNSVPTQRLEEIVSELKDAGEP